MSRSSRSSSRARPASVMPSGTSGTGARDRGVGFAVEVAADAARPPARAAAGSRPPRSRGGWTRSRSSVSCFSASARSVRRPSSRRPAARAASDCSGADVPAAARRAARSRPSARAEPAASRTDRGCRALFERGAPGPGPGLFVGPGREPRFDLGEPAPSTGAPLLDRRAAHLEVAAQRAAACDRSRSSSRARACGFVARCSAAASGRAASRCALQAASASVGFELRALRASSVAGRASRVATPHLDVAPQLGGAARRPGRARRAAGVRPRSPRSSARRAAARRWRATSTVGLGVAASVRSAASACASRVGERGRRDHRRSGRPGAPRARAAEAVAFAGDRHDARVGERDVERVLPAAVDEHERREQPGEHRIEPGPQAAHATRRAGACPRARTRSARPVARPSATSSSAWRSPRFSRSTAARAASSPSTTIAFERVAERGRDRDLAALVDVEEVDERTEHAVELDDRPRRRPRRGLRRARARASRRAPASATLRSSARAVRVVGVAAALPRPRAAHALRAVSSGATPACASTSARTRAASASAASAAAARGSSAAALGVDAAQLGARTPRRARRRSSRRGAVRAARARARHAGDSASASRDRARPPSAATSASAASTSARVGASDPKSASTAASCSRTCAASATSDSTTPSSATAASSRSSPRRRSVDEVHEPAAALAQRLGAARARRRRRRRRDRERALGVEHVGVERAQPHAHVLLLLGELAARRRRACCSRAAQLLDLAPGEVQADRVQLGDEAVVAARGVGLALERAQLPPHLAQQVGEAQEVALGRFEPALRLLLALAELQDARRPPR